MKPLSDWTEADLKALVTESQSEGRRWEFKRDQYKWNDAGTREFLADVSSFANAGGGMLLIGVDEEDGRASEVVGLDGSMDAALQRMTQKIQMGLEPRASGVEMRAIPVSGDKHVLAVRIPRSWAAPHMVTFGNLSRFFSRTSAGKYQLDVSEIRSHFLAGNQLAGRLRDFRLARINEVVSRTVLFPLREGPTLMLHAIPILAFEAGHTISLPPLEDVVGPLRPINVLGHSPRINFDGIASSTKVSSGEVISYMQLFRNGIIEATDSGLLEEWNGNQTVPSVAFERELLEAVGNFRKLLARLDLGLPVAWLLTLMGVRGYTMAIGMRGGASRQIDREILSVPEFIQEEPSTSEKIVRHLVDPVWQACGRERSPHFDDSGEWKPK